MSKDKTLYVKHKFSYGEHRYYPDNKLARTFIQIADRRSTFGPEAIDAIKSLGYKIVVKAEEREL